MTSPLLRPDGTPWRPSDVNGLHRYDDVDGSALAHHHTLGSKKNQAAPGDHGHSTLTSPATIANLVAPVNIISGANGETFIALAGDNGNIELGRHGVTNSPYIDFHSGATDIDYDSRVIANGARGSNTDAISLDAYYVQLGTSARNGGVDILKQDNTNEGGQINLKGAGAYGDTSIDNYQSNLRFQTPGGVPYVNTSGEFTSKRDNQLTEATQGGVLIKSGTATLVFSAAAAATVALSFTGDAFSANPVVTATIVTGSGSAIKATVFITVLSSTGMTIRVDLTAAATVNIPVHWHAIGSP